MMAALYLQVSIVSQALIFVTRSRSWSFVERPGYLLLLAFLVAQLVSISLIIICLGINIRRAKYTDILIHMDELGVFVFGKSRRFG